MLIIPKLRAWRVLTAATAVVVVLAVAGHVRVIAGMGIRTVGVVLGIDSGVLRIQIFPNPGHSTWPELLVSIAKEPHYLPSPYLYWRSSHFNLGLPVWISLCVLILIIFVIQSAHARRVELHCKDCGYCLIGLPVDRTRCPECGTLIAQGTQGDSERVPNVDRPSDGPANGS